jgi:hypothetical protein
MQTGRTKSDAPVDVQTRAGYISLLSRFPMKVEGGPECVTSGLPRHDGTLLVKPRNQRYRLRPSGRWSFTGQTLLREPRIFQLAGLPQAIAWVTGRTIPDAPLKVFGKKSPCGHASSSQGGQDSANMHLGKQEGLDTLIFFGWSVSTSVEPQRTCCPPQLGMVIRR